LFPGRRCFSWAPPILSVMESDGDGSEADEGYEKIEDFLPLFGVREAGATFDGAEEPERRGPLRAIVARFSGPVSLPFGSLGAILLILLIVGLFVGLVGLLILKSVEILF